MITEIKVSNQADAQDTLGCFNWCVISITDPEKPLAKLSENWGSVLRLQFHDKDNESLAKLGLWTMFSPEMARRCITYIENNKSKDGVLIHCFAGASRSPAVAKGLAQLLSIPVNSSWNTGNELVLKIMLEEVNRIKQKKDT